MSCAVDEALPGDDPAATPDDTTPVDETEAALTTPPLSLARTFVTDGYVTAGATDGRTLYLGGSFRYIGQRSGELALVSASTGARDKSITELGGGAVTSIIPDGAGGYFVAGDFRKAGSITTRALAHLTAAGTYDPAWKVQINGYVYALARDATRLYVGGSFTQVNGVSRQNFAAFDLSTGALVAGTPVVSGGPIYALAVSSTRLFVGGEFGAVAGTTRPYLARLDLPAMTLSSWNPGAPDNVVHSLLAYGSGLYVGGAFTQIGAAVRGHVASIDQATAVVRPYNPNTNGAVFTMQRLAGTLYLGGQFTTVGGASRNLVAAVDASTGALLPWHPIVGGGAWVRSLVATSTAVYFGGWFDTVGGQPRRWAAAVDPTTAAVLPWSPRPNNAPWVMALHPSGVLLGGYFTSVGGSARTNLAAIDLATGRATAFAPKMDPDPNARVDALLLVGSTLYIGGQFTSLGGQPRVNLGALTTAGAVLPFRADTGARVTALAYASPFLYAGGEFVQIGGIPRDHVAKLDGSLGTVMAWNVPFGGPVNSLLPVGATLYVGGTGTRLGAFDLESGAPRAVPTVDGEVQALAYDGTRIFVAGFYTTIGGVARNSLAAFVPGSTTVTAWNPPVPQYRRFSALAVTDNYVYAADVGKTYTLDASTAAIQTFSPRTINGEIFDYLALPDRLILVGSFHDIDNVAQSNVAEYLGTP
ncbi:MAG TPA: hypothetical protein VFQ53_05315 [Kofleriaceae bacterium]|nr:hypothetical protein [Kofleriaceae bacterium]